MKSEFIDIVDSNNQLKGIIQPRSVVHSRGLWHRTVHIYLFRREKAELKFLVHLRSVAKDLHPNKWDTRFGGHVKAGQSVYEAVLTELAEEIGLSLPLNDLIVGDVIKVENYPNNEFVSLYFLEYTKDIGSLHFDDDEVQRVAWMSDSEIKDSMRQNSDKWAANLEGFLATNHWLRDYFNSLDSKENESQDLRKIQQ